MSVSCNNRKEPKQGQNQIVVHGSIGSCANFPDGAISAPIQCHDKEKKNTKGINHHLPHGTVISVSEGGENKVIGGTDRPVSNSTSSSSSSSSSPDSGRAHGEIGNPSAAEGGGGAGGGAAGRRCVRRCGCGRGMGDPVREAGAESARCGGGT
jgi:hypothetical protein